MKLFSTILLLLASLTGWAQTAQPPANTSQVTNMVANGYYVSPAGLGDFYNYIMIPYVSAHAGGNTNALTPTQNNLLTNSVQVGSAWYNSVSAWTNNTGGGSGTATNLAGGALTQVTNVVSTATSGMVTNGLYFYPENYGAQGNGNLGGSGSDDTSAIQSAVNAAQLVGGTVFLSSKYYQISNSIIVTNTVTFSGCGISTLGASYLTNGLGVENLNVPTVAPYLLGSVLVQTSTNTTIVCKSLARALNLSNFGILVATNNGYQFASAGGGVLCQAPPLGGLSTNDIGIMSSEWKNVYVWGTGSNNFAFYVENGELNNFTHLESFGCAGFGYLCSMQAPVGNFVLTESTFFCNAPTILPTLSIVGTSTNMGYATHILLNQVQVLAYQSQNMYYNWRTPNLPFLSNLSAVNPANTFYVNNAAFITVNRCAFEDQAAHKRGVVFPYNQGGSVWESASVMGSFPYSVMDNPIWGTITPTIFFDGISFGANAQDLPQHKELIRYIDIPETSGSQYMFGVGLPDYYTLDNFMTPNVATYSWTWSGWDSNPSGLQTRHILAAIQDGTGNFTNTGSITAGNGFYGDGSHLTGLPSSGISSNNAAGIVSNTVTPSYVNSIGFTNVSTNGLATTGYVAQATSGMVTNNNTGTFNNNGNITVGGGIYVDYLYDTHGNQIADLTDTGNYDGVPIFQNRIVVEGDINSAGNIYSTTLNDQYGKLPASTNFATLTYIAGKGYVNSSGTVSKSTNATYAATATNAPDGNAIASLNAATNIANAAIAPYTNQVTTAAITNANGLTTNSTINAALISGVLPMGTLTTDTVTTNGVLYYKNATTRGITNAPTLNLANSTNYTGAIALSQLPSQVLTNGAAYQPTNGNLTTLATLNGNTLTNLNPTNITGTISATNVQNTYQVVSIFNYSGLNSGQNFFATGPAQAASYLYCQMPAGFTGIITNLTIGELYPPLGVGTNLVCYFYTNGVSCSNSYSFTYVGGTTYPNVQMSTNGSLTIASPTDLVSLVIFSSNSTPAIRTTITWRQQIKP